jgi:hypothetical protein
MPHSLDDLIRLEKISTVFSDSAVARIAADAGLSLGAGTRLEAARKTLASGVRASIRAYLIARRRQTPNTVHREVEDLARAAECGDCERLIDLLNNLSDEARHLLERRAANTLHMSELRAYGRQRLLRKTGFLLRERRLIVTLPTTDDLRDPGRRKAACEAVFRVAATGRGRDWEWSEHEPDIPSDGRRHDQKRLRLNAPKASKTEPRREAELQLLQHLQTDCYTATGRMPPTAGRHALPGPVDRFIAECFLRAGVPASEKDHDRRGLVVQRRNDGAPLRRRAALRDKWRELLEPWCLRYDIIDEVRRLLELGEARVLRHPAGTDDRVIPSEPAVIEFAEAGTVCFWRPPFGYRTIAFQGCLREEIMDLAGRLDTLNTSERRACVRRAAASRKRRTTSRRKTLVARAGGFDPTEPDQVLDGRK